MCMLWCLGTPVGALAQSVSVAEWNFTNASTPLNASVTNPAVQTSPVALVANGGITLTRSATGTIFEAAGSTWQGTEDAGFIATRTSLTPRSAKSLSTNFTLTSLANGDWSNLSISFRYQRPTTAPNRARAVITWQQSGVVKRAYTSAITLAGTAWTSSTTKFAAGDALPTTLAGLPCLVEFYFWGTSTTPNGIYLDDLKLVCNSLTNVYALAPASLNSWSQNRPYSAQFSVPGYSGTPTWSVSGAIPSGLTLNTSTGELSGTPSAISSSTFTVTATGSGGLNVSKSYVLNIVAPPVAMPACNSVAKLTFDGDTSATSYSAVPPADVATCYTEFSFGYDATGTMSGSLHSGGKNVGSGNPINPAFGGQMRCFLGWDATYGYNTARNELLHYNVATSASQARFGVYPSANTSSIPMASQTNKGEASVWQTRIKLDPNASGDLRAFYFDALRWQKDLMDVPGTNGPRWAELHAYWTNDAGVVQRWDSPTIDIQAVYLPEHRAVNQYSRYWVDLNSGPTGLNPLIRSTTSKYRSRTVFFDLYLWHDAGADLTTLTTANPPVILIDELGVAGNFTCVVPQMGIGNTVFNDTNYNGHFDRGEGVAGVRVELLNTSNVVLRSTTTTAGGNYLFSGLAEGSYKVRIPASEFASGKPLYQLRSIAGAGGDSGVDDGVDENGIDDASPSINGIYSGVIALSMDSEPGTSETGNNTAADNADDDNTDLTVDFGFVASPLFCVGNRVFKDSNGNSTYDPGEGADGVTVQLLNSSNSVLATQTTANGGLYLFSGLSSSQSYYVRVAPANFNPASVLDGFLSVTGNGTDNGVDNDDNGVDDAATTANGIKSVLITPDASQGGVFSYTWPPSSGASMSNQGGTWYQITARHNYVTDQMDMSVTLDTATQNTQALWMVITNGVTPTSADTNYAAFYLANGTVTVTPYGSNPTVSHTLGTIITTTPYTITNVGTKRTFRFSLDVSTVNQWSGAPSTWLGTGFPYDAQGGFPDVFNKKIGLWMRSFADGSATLSGSSWTISWGGAADPNIGTLDDVMPLTEVGCDTTVDFGFKPPGPSDFGDWNGSGAATASTSSIRNNNLRLGASVDAETSVVPDALATADGADEDGVSMPQAMTQAAIVTLPVSVFNNTGANAYLHGWIDFNNDGTFNDALVSSGGERLEAARSVGSSGAVQIQNVSFTVPSGASVGTQRGVRFRLTNVAATGPVGTSGSGEVEDYVVRVCSVMAVCPAVSYLPTATQGAAYSMTIAAVGGTPGYSYAIVSGALNPGLTLNSTSGVIGGSATAIGARTFTIQATDSTGCVVTRTYTLDVVAAGSVIQVVGGSGSGNVPIQRAIYQVGSSVNTQNSEAAGVLVPTNSAINLTSLTVNDAGTSKTLAIANLNGASVANLSLSSAEANVGVLLNGTATSIASSGVAAFATHAAQVATNTNLNHYIYDDRGEGEPDATGEYDIRFNYGLTTDDYVVVQERSGNSHVQLQPLDATGNVIAGSRTVQVRGTHDWNTGYASASYQSGQPYYLTAIRQSIFGTTSPIFGFRLSIFGADCKFFAMSDNSFTDNPTSAGLIGDLVWNDSNRNGIQDAGEPGVSGVTVRLLDAGTSATVASTTTNASGIYSFVSIAPGNYRVEFALPPGYFFATQNQGSNDARDSDADLVTGRTEIFTMMPCDSLSHYDAGIYGIDFGDHPGFASASQTAVAGIRIGTNATDVEAANPTATGATADDTTGVDDEDLTMPVFTEGSTTTLTIPVTLNTTTLSGNTSRIAVFADWNGDGDVLDANETITPQAVSTNGTSTVNFTLTPPNGTVAGTKYLRVRIVEGISAPAFSGASTLKGEVEDYAVTVNAASQCFSVAGGTTALYRVNHLTGAVTTITNAPYNVKSVAYDGASKTLYYNEYAWPNGRLGKYNITTNTHTNIGNIESPASGTWSFNPSQRPSSLTYISGKLYYVHPGSDDLVRIDLNVGETAITNQVKVADLTNNARSLGWVGDLTVSPDGLLWVAAHYELGHWNPVTRVFTTIATYPSYTDPSSAYFMALMHDNTTGFLYGQKAAAVSTSIFRINKTTGAEAIQAATTPVHDSWDYACAEPAIDLTPPVNDFGDWNGSGAGNPFWVADAALTLGASVDAELNSARNSSATGDDTTGVDDEDGVTWPTFQAGGSFKVSVDTRNSTPDYCSMQGWVDWNNNGTFEASEALWTEWGSFVWIDPAPTPWTLTNLPAAKVPVGAVTGVPLGARVRIIRSLEDPPNPVSSGTVFGEVEDYTVTVQPRGYDHGDYASFGDASSLTNPAFTIGQLVDAEATAATTTNADGDDNSNNDDEDGVWAGVIAQGQTNAQILVELNNTLGVTGYLNVWVDFNRNGSLIDAGEQVATNIAVPNASTYYAQAVNFNVPVGASVGTAGVRVRFTTTASPGPVGASAASVSGEVEDVAINIEPAPQAAGCYHFAFKDVNRDLDFLDLGETMPSQGNLKDYWAGMDTITHNGQLDPGESVKGWIDNLDMKYDRAAQQLTVDVTIGRNRGADLSQLYFAVNSGAMPTLSNNLALVYIDGYNAANPVVTVYKYDPSLASGTFLNRQLMVSTAAGGPNASDVVSKSVTRSASGTRFQLVLNCARINNAANWAAYGITAGTWNGVQFANTAGMWIHANALTGPQTYDSSGNMTVANQGNWRDEEVFIDTNPSSAFLAEGCFDFGDYAGFAPAFTSINSNLYLGATPPDANPTDPSTIAILGDNAIGDDNTGSDDEDITTPVLTPGAAMNLVVPVFNNTGSNAFLSVWIDYNANHAVDAGEQVVVNQAVASQAAAQSLSYPITVPAAPALGAYLAVRYRLSSISGTGLTGAGGFGEVEDHMITIGHPIGGLTFDFTSLSSFPGTTGQTFTAGGVTATVTSSENFAPAAWQNYSGGPSTTLYMRGGTGAVPPSGNTRTIQVNFSQPILFQSGIVNLDLDNQSYTFELIGGAVWSAFKVLDSIDREADYNAPVGVGSSTVTIDWSDGSGNSRGDDAWWTISGPVTGIKITQRVPGALTYSGENVSFCFGSFTIAPGTDYGDAPAFAVASQYTSADIRVGTVPTDSDLGNPTTGSANVDDTTGADDEDLVMPAFTVGVATNLTIPVTLNTAALSGNAARVRVFADWNGDGDVLDVSETLNGQTVSTNGSSNVIFSITPPTGTPPGTKYLRVRATEGTAGPTFSGASTLKGEVEDYVISVGSGVVSDFGDWNGIGAATSTTSSAFNASLRIGATVDSEVSVTPDVSASADGADEDGVWFAPTVTVGSYAQLSVKATNLTSAAAYLNAWVDFNANGTFDTGEQVATNVLVPANTTNYDPSGYNAGNSLYQYYRLQFAVPASASVGTGRGVRVRLTNVLDTPATGASGTGEVEDYTMAFTAQAPCYHFRLADANGDMAFNPATEIVPSQSNAPFYWDQSGNMGSFKSLDATFSPGSKLFTFDCTVQQISVTGTRTDGIWFMINTGPLPLQTPVQRYAMVYLDAFDRAAPKVTVYVENSLQHGGSWQVPGNLMVSSAPGGLNSGDVKVLAVTEDTVAKTVRFRLTLDCTRINDRSLWPVAWNLDPDWRGIQFFGNAGLWCTATDMTAAPTYNASGKATAMNMAAASLIGIDVHPMGFQPMLTEGCGYDFGDHFFGITSAGAQLTSADLRIGANATDAEGDYSDGGAALDDGMGVDDEDLTMPVFPVGSATSLVIPVTIPVPSNLSGSTARINVFADWNGDGDVLDTNETLTAQTVAATGNVTFSLTPPAGTTTGTKYLRIRITEGSTAPAFAGVSTLKGEVEDYAVTVGADPNCYTVLLANYNTNTVQKLDGSTGTVSGTLISGGSLNNPAVLSAAPDGKLLVGNFTGNNVLRYDPYSGSLVGTLVAAGSGGLNAPASITYGPDGNLYVTSYNNGTVLRYNGSTGALIGTFVSVSGPIGCVFDTAGNCYVLSDGNEKIFKYNSTGTLLSTVYTWTGTPSLGSMVWGPDGNLYVAVLSGTTPTIDKITLAGVRTAFITLDAGSEPIPLAWMPDGKLWVGDSAEDELTIYNSTGTLLQTVTNAGFSRICALLPIPCAACDFGDLPLPYPTNMAANGPRHVVGASALKMGTASDIDGDGQPKATANGDDTDSDGDDEDGVTIPTLNAGGTATVVVNASGAGKVNAFFDWNNDGDFLDANETITELSVVAGNNNLSVPVPAAAVTGTSLGARFRISTAGGLTSLGGASDGEVEDYMVTINAAATNLAVGNLVWIDANDNGRFDAAEGVNGVTVKLFPQGTAITGTPTATTTTAAVNGINGCYSFTSLNPGSYYVHIPASNFASGQPLFGKYSMVSNGPDNGRDDDWDENGIDNAAPATNGISSNVFALSVGGEPTTNEGGQNGTWDDGSAGKPTDNNCDLTIDFGFALCPQTNLFTNGGFEIANPVGLTFTNRFPDPATGAVISVNDYANSASTMAAGWNLPYAAYINEPTKAPEGSRFVYISTFTCIPIDFAVGAPIAGLSQLTPGQTYTLTFDFCGFDHTQPTAPSGTTDIHLDWASMNADLTNEFSLGSTNTMADRFTGTIINYAAPLSAWSNLQWKRLQTSFVCPTLHDGRTRLKLQISGGPFLIDNVALVASCTPRAGSVGNLLFTDYNANGRFDAGDAGLDDIVVQLQREITPGNNEVVGTTFTHNGGRYFFPDVPAGRYRTVISYENWGANAWWPPFNSTTAGPLVGYSSSTGNGNPDVAAASAVDDSGDENGVDEANPAVMGLNSSWFNIAVGTEPTTGAGVNDKENGFQPNLDSLGDSNGDMTIDFGFVPPAGDRGDYLGFASASSAVNASLKLGANAPDADATSLANATASGDDANGTDDEDGVTLPAQCYSGSYVPIIVNVTNSTGANAYLNGWVDFNNNNTFDTGEQVVTNHTVATGTSLSTRTFYAQVPPDLTAATVGARFRISSSAFAGPVGSAGSGEVEDYTIAVVALPPCGTELLYNGSFEYGSVAPLSTAFTTTGTADKFPNSTLQATNNAMTYAWQETVAIPNWWSDVGSWVDNSTKATHGTKFTYLERRAGNPTCAVLPVGIYGSSISSDDDTLGPKVYLQLGKTYTLAFDWTAFDRAQTAGNAAQSEGPMIEYGFMDASWIWLPAPTTITSGFVNRNTGAAIASTQTMRAWTSLAWNPTAITFTVPATIPAGAARFQLFISQLNSNGMLVDNISLKEVCPPDLGDHIFGSLAASTASQQSSADIRIGTNATDGEASDPSDANANKDDTTGTNDEDLTMPVFPVGSATSLVIPVTIPVPSNLSGSTARINVFADWNGDGDVLDTNETLTAQTVAATGNATFSLTPPAGTTAGTKYLRIRLTEGSTAPTFAGSSALKGEVEDYAVVVGAGNLRIGNLVFSDNNSNGKYDAGDAGVDGVTVELVAANNTAAVLQNAVTAGGGRYAFSALTAGSYLVRIPASQFQTGRALANKMSSPNWKTDSSDDDASENGIDSMSPDTQGCYSNVITLTAGALPTNATTETGLGNTTDDTTPGDANGDLTVDFGFVPKCAAPKVLVGELLGSGGTRTMVFPWVSSGPAACGILPAGGDGMIEDAQQGVIYLANPNGAVMKHVVATGVTSVLYDTGNGSLKLALSPSGAYLYITDALGLYMVNTSTAALVASVPVTSFPAAGWLWGVAVHPQTGEVYVSRGFNPSTGYQGGIYKLAANLSGPITTIVSQPNSDATLMGIKFMPDGTFWVVQSGTGSGVGAEVLFHYSATGTLLQTSALMPGSWNSPSDLDLGPDGKLYVATWFNYCVLRYTPTTNAWDTYLSFDATANGKALAFVCSPLACGTDYGDHVFGSLAASTATQTASAAIHVGTNATDGEVGDPSDTSANKDDTTGTNDEDLTMPTFVVGSATNLVIPVSIPVPASLSGSTARINVFIDWNADGDVTDAGETQTAQTIAATGNATFSLTPPAGTTAGTKYLRIRITEGSTAPTFAGASALKGEVEDYAVTVNATGSYMIGNLVFADLNGNGVYDSATETGVPNVGVQLWKDGGDNIPGTADDTQVGVGMSTNSNGAFSLTGPGGQNYFLKVIPSTFYPKVTTGGLDPDSSAVDSDNNGTQVAVTAGYLPNPIYTPVFTLSASRTDIDIGVVRYPVSVCTDPILTFNYEGNTAEPIAASQKHAALSSGGTLQINGLTSTSTTGNGSTYARDYNGWPSSDTYPGGGTRASLSASAKSVYSQFTFASGITAGSIGNLRYDVKLPQSYNSAYWTRVYLVWTVAGTTYQACTRDVEMLPGAAWTTRAFDEPFVYGTPLPTGAALSGVTFLLEIDYWWTPHYWDPANVLDNAASTARNVQLDNVVLCSPGITLPTSNDFGDHIFGSLAASTASQTASADIKIGTNATDAEASDPSDANASKDDTTGTDDEDLTMPALIPGTTSTMSFNVMLSGAVTSGRLGAWVDWNADGDVDDTGEVLTPSVSSLVTGTATVTLTLTPPATLTNTTAYLRLRLAEGTTAPAFSGSSTARGEVEDYALSVSCPTITVGPASMPGGMVGDAYSQTVTAAGGTAPYRFTVIAGSLPPGLALDSVTGVLDGKPTTAGAYAFTVAAVDAMKCDGTQSLTITITSGTTDYSDLPDTGAGTGAKNYKTLASDNGPSHTINVLTRLGLTVDGESDGQPDDFGTGDGSDDDGVASFPAFVRGTTVTVPVSVFHNGTAAQVNLYTFIDWNNDGDFLDAGEAIAAVPVSKSAAQQTVNVSIPVPATAALDCVGLRLRVSPVAGLTATGPGGNGEVEDYFITVLPAGSLMDYGDHLFGSLANSASNVASTVIYLGATPPDGEAADPSNANATADDLAGTNDEDLDDMGTVNAGGLLACDVPVTACSAIPVASFAAWVDWNGDNDFADPGEVVIQTTSLKPGTTVLAIVFSPPAGTTPGTKYVRYRLQEGSVLPSPSGASPLKGEVEDGVITVTTSPFDYGDADALAAAWAVPSTSIRLGNAATDADSIASTNASATADDASGVDDEDGVSVSTMASGSKGYATIVLTNTTAAPAYLSGWIDFNGTPGIVEPGEMIIDNVVVAPGTNAQTIVFDFTAPSGITTTRSVFARFRLSSVSGTDISGAGGDGEVEDYLVRICPPLACGQTTSVKN